MAQLDACLTGDKEAAGSNPAGSATFICGEIMKYFAYHHSLPSSDTRRVSREWTSVGPVTMD